MIKGINGKPYVDLEPFIDHTSFSDLHFEICRGFALAKQEISIGNLEVPQGYMNTKIYEDSIVPLFKLHDNFLNLPNSDPLKSNGADLPYSELSTYLKYAYGGFDLYSYYFLIDFKEGWRTKALPHGMQPSADYFPGVIKWVNSLIDANVFSHIGRAGFFLQEAGGISFEHKDPSVDPEYPEVLSEFIHIRPNLKRPFYVKDIDTEEKIYIESCIAYWNDQDFHGGDSVMEPTYAFRVDGVFTDAFRQRVLNAK